MNDAPTDTIAVAKPLPFWSKPLKADCRGIFKAVGKIAVHTVTNNWEKLAEDAVEAVSAVGLGDDPGGLAWMLIRRALIQAFAKLVVESRNLSRTCVDDTTLETIFEAVELILEEKEYRIDREFFLRPDDHPVVQDVRTPFRERLAALGLDDAQSNAVCGRLPSYFTFALREQWRVDPKTYAPLQAALEADTPFDGAQKWEWNRLSYAAWLKAQIDAPMFGEAFGLRQVYIDLRAYYRRKIETGKVDRGQRRASSQGDPSGEPEYERVVVDLKSHLYEWLQKADRSDAIRIVSGGPGSGKSSFAKIFAAQNAEEGTVPVLFIPLHLFDPGADLIDAVGRFVRDDGYFPSNLLDGEHREPRVLIVFDGLDELSKQGKVGSEIAGTFMEEVRTKVGHLNMRTTRIQVLISGREPVIQSISAGFRKPEQVLHLMPYFVSDKQASPDERSAGKAEPYIYTAPELDLDQRPLWWVKYGAATGRAYTGLPEDLDKIFLQEINSQPLLNYLLALSHVRKKIDFSGAGNLNVIYRDLLTAVFEREWAGCRHPGIRDISEEHFTRILEEIAVTAWHGQGRTAGVREIEVRCDSRIRNLFEVFEKGVRQGINRLLTAFYFRKSDQRRDSGDETFEFTHKSFGEYLTARRIVATVQDMDEELKRSEKRFGTGWNEQEALERWAKLCGPIHIDEELLKFVRNEMQLCDGEDVREWQKTLCRLIGYMLRNGLPMEKLGLACYQDQADRAGNAEVALLAVLDSCALSTDMVSDIDWPSDHTFRSWIYRLLGRRAIIQSFLIWDCLSYLNISRFNLMGINLYETNFRKANLQKANLECADFRQAEFQDANLHGVNLKGAVLRMAGLREAKLGNADLRNADLRNADLIGANLHGAKLKGAKLKGAIIDDECRSTNTFEGVIWD